MTSNSLSVIRSLIAKSSTSDRKTLLEELRKEFPIHSLEQKWNVPAEVILEAIARSPDLTQRGVRGVIADASFGTYIVPALVSSGWADTMPPGNHAFDYQLTDATGDVRIQVKMQRQKGHRPMLASEGYRRLPSDQYVVETQRTRGGVDSETGESTRPYRFGEFDLLAVALHPSTGRWDSFTFTVANWLLPDENPLWMLKFQPVAKHANQVWTTNFDEAVTWLRSGEKRSVF